MMRRTVAVHSGGFVDSMRNNEMSGSYLTWRPEIRMLDKDERLVEPELSAKMREHVTLTPGPTLNFPPYDPLNPTWEQRRASNTNVNDTLYVSQNKGAWETGFRTIPDEMIDWRTTTYGCGLDSLPFVNEKLSYQMPDYVNAGCVEHKDESIAASDNTPRTAETGDFGRPLNPKFFQWYTFVGAFQERNNGHVSVRKILYTLLFGLLCYKITNWQFRMEVCLQTFLIATLLCSYYSWLCNLS